MDPSLVFASRFWNSIFGADPLFLALFFLGYAIFLLAICKKELRSIPPTKKNGNSTNTGYYYSFNWSLISVIVVPVIVYHLASFVHEIPLAIKGLIETSRIVPKLESVAPQDFIGHLHATLTRYEMLGIGGIFIISILINICDFRSYFNKRDSRGYTIEKDWIVLFQGWDEDKKVSKRYNLFFDALAYFWQWMMIFFSMVILYKLIVFFFYFYNLIGDSNSSFSIQLNLLDPVEQLGLWPLSTIVELYLRLIVLVTVYLAILRFIKVTRKIAWELGPQLIAYAGTFIVAMLIVIPLLMVSNKIDRRVLEEKIVIAQKLNTVQPAEDTLDQSLNLLNYLKVNGLKDDLLLVSKQSILPMSAQRVYIYLFIFLLLFRLILKPPKSWVEFSTRLLGKDG